MNETTKKFLDTAKAENASRISKQDFINAVKDVFSQDTPLPTSLSAPDDFRNPYVGYEVKQDAHTHWGANPFQVLIEWYGIDDITGYVLVYHHLFGNGGTADDLVKALKFMQDAEKYFLVDRCPNRNTPFNP